MARMLRDVVSTIPFPDLLRSDQGSSQPRWSSFLSMVHVLSYGPDEVMCRGRYYCPTYRASGTIDTITANPK